MFPPDVHADKLNRSLDRPVKPALARLLGHGTNQCKRFLLSRYLKDKIGHTHYLIRTILDKIRCLALLSFFAAWKMKIGDWSILHVTADRS